jgi:environmental stress-induced protein Ves
MKVAPLPAMHYARQRWKNGGGTTAEIARQESGDRWRWRVSIADVEMSGPFSDFTGYRRVIALLDGAGMALSFDETPAVVIDRPYRPFSFDGGWRADCRLIDGPVRDLNLIVDAALSSATLEFHHAERSIPIDIVVRDCALLHAIHGAFEVRAGASFALLQGDALRIDEGAGARLRVSALDGDAVLACARIG